MARGHVATRSPGGLLRALRAATHGQHRALERLPAFELLLAPTLDVTTFGVIQAQFYGVFAPLEATMLETQLWSQLGLPPALRAHELAGDLIKLGYHPHALPRHPVADRMDFAASAGIAYVLEGSRLGAPVVARALCARPWYRDRRQRFYDVAAPEHRWPGLMSALEDCVQPAQYQASADAAKSAFSAFHRWMSHIHGPATRNVTDGRS